MKIALVSSYGVYCGIAHYTYHLTEELLKNKIEVRIFARYKEEEEIYTRGLKKLPLEVVRCWSSQRNTSLKKLYFSLKKFNPDVIHIQDIFRREEGIKKIYEIFSRKIIMTFHSIDAPKSVRFHKVLNIGDREFIERVKNCINHFIVHNELSKKSLIKNLKIEKERISVIDHGTLLPPNISKTKAREILKIPQDIILILTYGFFTPRKGLNEMVEIMPDLIKEIPNLYYFHVGRKRLKKIDKYFREYQTLNEKIRHSSFKKRTKIIWKYLPEKKIELYLIAADLIPLLYPNEAPLLHASGIAHQVIASGNPVIATDVNTFSEFPKNSLYKIPYNKEKLKEGIIKILRDKALQKELIKNALKYSQLTSWKNTAKRHIEAYKKI